VVGIPVHDEHPLAAVGQGGGGHSDVVQQAEAHRSPRRGVMAGGPHHTEGGIGLAPVEPFDGVDTGARPEGRRRP